MRKGPRAIGHFPCGSSLGHWLLLKTQPRDFNLSWVWGKEKLTEQEERLGSTLGARVPSFFFFEACCISLNSLR